MAAPDAVAGRPWLTLTMAAVAVVVGMVPPVREGLIYDRSAVFGGQWWRLWTGHLVHHGASHLLWNLAVFTPAGVLLERIRPALTRSFLVAMPLAISLVLLVFDPLLERYAGLSGVAAGVLLLLALVHLRADAPEPVWIWGVLAALVVGKIGYEFVRRDDALFAGLPDGVRNVPLAHLAGAVGATLVWLVIEGRDRARRR